MDQYCWKHILESQEEKLLGLNIDRDLKFTSHVSKICAKAGQNLTAISRIVKYMSFEKRRMLIKTFFIHSLNIVHSPGCSTADN